MRSEQIWAQAGKRVGSGHLGPCTHVHGMHTPHIQHMQIHANTCKHTRTQLPVLPQTWLLLIQVGHKQDGADSMLTGPSQMYSAWSMTLLSFRKVNAVYLIYPCEASARQQADEMWKSNEK